MRRQTMQIEKMVNEIFHDIEAEWYGNLHPEIENERKVWDRLGWKYFVRDEPLTVLDIGTGTGFVPSIIADYLEIKDWLICTDISEKMIRKAQAALDKADVMRWFIVADAVDCLERVVSVDIVTMNSVLHHLPDYEAVLLNVAKIIKPNGLFILTHERNSRFVDSPYWIQSIYGKCRKAAGKVYRKFKRPDEGRRTFMNKVQYEILRKTGTLYQPAQINAMVDIHDPDEGGKGFDPYLLHSDFFPGFTMEEVWFDKYLGPWVENRWLEEVIKENRPDTGAVFGMVLRKQ